MRLADGGGLQLSTLSEDGPWWIAPAPWGYFRGVTLDIAPFKRYVPFYVERSRLYVQKIKNATWNVPGETKWSRYSVIENRSGTFQS